MSMRQTLWAAAGGVVAIAALLMAALIGGVVGAAWGIASGLGLRPEEREVSGEGPDKIALVHIDGPIAREAEGGLLVFGPIASSQQIVEQLDRALKDPAVRAVILELDTPGGSVVASAEVHRKVRALRAAGKPVVALMTETAASGGYYIAAGADAIIADPATVTGSIGVIVVLPNLQELDKKIGLRTVVFKSGAFKDMGNPDRSMTSAEAAIFQRLVDEVFQQFVGIVAQGRKMPRSRVRQLADGRIYTGVQAQRLGLVDRLGDRDEAVREAKRRARIDNARVIEYVPGGLLGSLFGMSAPRLRAWWLGRADFGSAPGAPFSLQYLMVP